MSEYGSESGVDFPIRHSTERNVELFRQDVVPTYTMPIRAYVEAIDKLNDSGEVDNIDVEFWKSRFNNAGLSVEVYSVSRYPNNPQNTTGKGQLIKLFDGVELSKTKLACVDTDYDKFRNLNRKFYLSDFTFETYYYSVENILYYPQGLEKEIQKHIGVSYQDQLNDINNIVRTWSYEYYLKFISSIHSGQKNAQIDTLINPLSLGYVRPSHHKKALSRKVRKRYMVHGIRPWNLFSYFRGHAYENALYLKNKSVIRTYVTNLRRRAVQDGTANNSIFRQQVDLPKLLRQRNMDNIGAVKLIDQDIEQYKNKYI